MMMDEKRVLFVLLFLLFLSIALQSLSGGWVMVWNVLQYLIIGAVFFAVLRYKLFLRPLLGEQFIDGKYVGQSVMPNDQANPITEEFTIVQTLLTTEISGKSSVGNTLLATWHGKLIDTRPKIYRFLLDVSMGGVETLGVLTLRIEDGTAEGFFQSLEAPHPKHRAVFSAILKAVYETRQSQWWIMEKLQKNNTSETTKPLTANTLQSPSILSPTDKNAALPESLPQKTIEEIPVQPKTEKTDKAENPPLPPQS